MSDEASGEHVAVVVSGAAKKAGLPPGTAVYTGHEPTDRPIEIEVYDYRGADLEVCPKADVAQVIAFAKRSTVTWVNVVGLHDVEKITALCKPFDVHPLTIEDIVSVGSRPKLDEHENYIFIVLKMLDVSEHKCVGVEHLAVLVRPGLVMTFQEFEGDAWEPIRRRLREGAGRLRQMQADYLAYALLDAVVDHYFVVLERLGSQLSELEEIAWSEERHVDLGAVFELRKEVLLLRKIVWPLRDVVAAMMRVPDRNFGVDVQPYLRDLHDHVLQVLDTLEMYRETTTGLVELELSLSGYRLNTVMKVLSIIATVFMPMTFVAGVYGMNFDYLPFNHEVWGFPAAMLLMVSIGATMLVWFRRNHWL